MGSPRKRRHYTDADRATALAALDANKGNIRKTARDTSISASTITGWRDSGILEGTEVRAQKKADLADKLEAVAHTLVGAMPDKIHDATLQQVATSLGITIDKLRLLREESTSIEEVRSSDAKDRLAERLAQRLQPPT